MTYTTEKIKELRNIKHCHFCGEARHIKKTCCKKLAFDNTRRIPPPTH